MSQPPTSWTEYTASAQNLRQFLQGLQDRLAPPPGRLSSPGNSGGAGPRIWGESANTSVSDTTLTDEYVVAMLGVGIKLLELREMLMNAVDAAFLPDDEKEKLRAWFRQRLSTGGS